MICKRVKEQIPEYLSDTLAEQSHANLLNHLDSCSACRDEVARLMRVAPAYCIGRR